MKKCDFDRGDRKSPLILIHTLTCTQAWLMMDVLACVVIMRLVCVHIHRKERVFVRVVTQPRRVVRISL